MFCREPEHDDQYARRDAQPAAAYLGSQALANIERFLWSNRTEFSPFVRYVTSGARRRGTTGQQHYQLPLENRQ